MNDQLSATPGDIPQFFDIAALRRHRARAAAGYTGFDFLKAEAAMRLADRVDFMRRVDGDIFSLDQRVSAV